MKDQDASLKDHNGKNTAQEIPRSSTGDESEKEGYAEAVVGRNASLRYWESLLNLLQTKTPFND